MAAGLWVPVSVGLAPTVADDDIGVGGVADGCLLSGVKQTSHFKGVTTVFDPKADIEPVAGRHTDVIGYF